MRYPIRFIPACAGNIARCSVVRAFQAVHPRVRGEHCRTIPVITSATRFIPACAGNINPPGPSWSILPVHPRVRGEHSSRAMGPHSKPRFIPACAGNIRGTRLRAASIPVHPRVRGEHCQYTPGIRIASGSSPRARGTSKQDPARIGVWRFIPACAGNITWSRAAYSQKTVHPRVRGEHTKWGYLPRPSTGSSPRARGTYRLDMRPTYSLRFIPACAGNIFAIRKTA